jgi:hypothetical protein
VVKRLQVFAAEDPGERPEREEKAGRRGDPARAVLGQRAAGHDTVQMQVLGEILAPGMEDRGAADVTTEVARIAAKGGERRGDRVEEQCIEDPGIALRERVQGVGQGKHHVEVLHGQQLGAPGGEPARFGQGLALRAVAVTARFVGDPLGAAPIARLSMTAEGGGAAGLDGLHRATLRAGQRVRVAVRRSVGAEDVGDLHRGARARARRRLGRRHRAHGLRETEGLGQIQG